MKTLNANEIEAVTGGLALTQALFTVAPPFIARPIRPIPEPLDIPVLPTMRPAQ